MRYCTSDLYDITSNFHSSTMSVTAGIKIKCEVIITRVFGLLFAELL